MAKTPFQLDSIFCLHSITVVTLSKPIHFVVLKRSRTKKSPWIKSKTKPGLNMKKINEFYPLEGKIWLKVTRARGSINSQKAKPLVLHLWMYQQSVRKNNGKQKKAMLRESDFQKRVRIILRRRILHCTKRMPPCIFETTLRHFLLGLVLFCGSSFFSFRFVLCWPWLKHESPWTRTALSPWFVFVLMKEVAFISILP